MVSYTHVFLLLLRPGKVDLQFNHQTFQKSMRMRGHSPKKFFFKVIQKFESENQSTIKLGAVVLRVMRAVMICLA